MRKEIKARDTSVLRCSRKEERQAVGRIGHAKEVLLTVLPNMDKGEEGKLESELSHVVQILT